MSILPCSILAQGPDVVAVDELGLTGDPGAAILPPGHDELAVEEARGDASPRRPGSAAGVPRDPVVGGEDLAPEFSAPVAGDEPDPAVEDFNRISENVAFGYLRRELLPGDAVCRTPRVVVEHYELAVEIDEVLSGALAEGQIAGDLRPVNRVRGVPRIGILAGVILPAEDPDFSLKDDRVVEIALRQIRFPCDDLPFLEVQRPGDLRRLRMLLDVPAERTKSVDHAVELDVVQECRVVHDVIEFRLLPGRPVQRRPDTLGMKGPQLA